METNALNFNPYLSLATPVFEAIKPFCSGDRGESLAVDYGVNCKIAINNFEKQAIAQQLSSNEIAQVKYALVALVDEVISTSAWEHRYQWMGRPLQMEYFSEHLAGEGFFSHLAELRQAGPQNINILEVYYTCLQLGFAGMYGISEREKLLALTVELQNYLAMIRGIANRKLSTVISSVNKLAGKIGRRLPFWIVASVTAVLLLLIYVGYSIAIDHHANAVLETFYARVHHE